MEYKISDFRYLIEESLIFAKVPQDQKKTILQNLDSDEVVELSSIYVIRIIKYLTKNNMPIELRCKFYKKIGK